MPEIEREWLVRIKDHVHTALLGRGTTKDSLSDVIEQALSDTISPRSLGRLEAIRSPNEDVNDTICKAVSAFELLQAGVLVKK